VLTGVASASAGELQTFAVKTDGTLWFTGWNDSVSKPPALPGRLPEGSAVPASYGDGSWQGVTAVEK
jgi:hypothetical protein